ncbi:DivIVA domain-containing protein [Actinomadura kijaniata]|uniref:DivIVA domain-containing protein n=1 Tax=Actinomadura kijaniata TaxID=46161 RepID=UPI003F1AD6D1
MTKGSRVVVETGGRLLLTRPPVVMRGYHREQVDALLERIRTAMDGGGGLTADEVRATRLDVVMRGYDRRVVDELLMECVRRLRASGPRTRRAGRPRAHPEWLIGWIQSARFGRAGLRTGYDVRDVDAFLDRVVAGLRGSAAPVAASDVRGCAFRTVRFGAAYDEGEVDRFLEQLAVALERR